MRQYQDRGYNMGEKTGIVSSDVNTKVCVIAPPMPIIAT